MINSVGVKNNSLKVMATNDIHGNLQNVAGLIGASKKMDSFERNPNMDTLRISAGDNWAGGDVNKNKLVSSFLDYMGVEFSAIGNHEFDDGPQAFADKISATGIKFLSANMDISPGHPLYGKVEKSTVKNVNGTNYGIIGATTPDLISCVSKKEDLQGISVYDEAKTFAALQQESLKLMEQGVDRIILASHCGLEFDAKIAQNVSGVDLIVSGHSHDEVDGVVEGKNYFKSPSGEPVLIVQGGESANNYNLTDIVFDEKGSISQVSNNMQRIKSSQNAAVDYIKDSVMGSSPLVGNILEVDSLKGNRRLEPNGWANFICDAMKSELGVDIAIMNAANLRKVPVAGRLTERDIIETTPMKNKLLTTTMSEEQIVSALKFASKSIVAADGGPGLLQVSGLKYKINAQGDLLSASFVDKIGNAVSIDIQNPSKEKTYTVAYDSFMAEGREYPDFVLNGRAAQHFEYDKDKTAIDYLKKLPEEQRNNMKFINDGRIEIVQTSAPQQSSSSMQSFLMLTSPKIA